MSTSFGWASTTDDVLHGLDLRGKQILVTGVSAGLGTETTRALAAHGACVTGTARDLDKARAATAELGGEAIDLVQLDLADLRNVRACADALVEAATHFDVIIANAGVMMPPFGHTADGFETQFGTNHLGQFVLINRLVPLLREGSRVVVLSSAAHRISDVDLDDPNFERTEYVPPVAYGRSKTANALFAVEFDRRHRDRGVRAASVHPGVIQTELTRHLPPGALEEMVEHINSERAGSAPAMELKSIPQGAATSVWAGVRASAEEVGGAYCEDCHVGEIIDNDDVMAGGVRPYALDPERAAALWDLSEKLLGERF